MRITVMGTGGVGGHFGARLAQGGHDVAFVARGRRLEALRADGLRVESPLGDVHLRDVYATDKPAEIGTADLVLFTVKLWDTQEAAESVRPVLGENTAVVSFQNGVVKDDILRQALGVPGGLGQRGLPGWSVLQHPSAGAGVTASLSGSASPLGISCGFGLRSRRSPGAERPHTRPMPVYGPARSLRWDEWK